MKSRRIIAVQTDAAASTSSSHQVRVTEGHYAASERQEKHAHSYASISFVFAGSLQETVGRTPELAFPFSTAIKPCGVEHADHFGTTGARLLSVQFPEKLIASFKDWHSGFDTWRWVHGGLPARLMLRLLKMYRQPSTSNCDLENCLYEILSALPCHHSCSGATPIPRWLQLVKQDLDDTFAEGVRVSDLAARSHVHPVYLARQFRLHVGCSITEYRKLLKARAAARALDSPDVSFAAVADQFGFADQSHFGRAFKSVTGLTPLDYRRLSSSARATMMPAGPRM
jgi:AraC family transcriptional regulator